MFIALIILALLACGVGVVELSQVTTGVGIICGACLLAILARIAQASAHADQLHFIRIEMEKLNAREVNKAQAHQGEVAPK
jgi:hypothetical protein